MTVEPVLKRSLHYIFSENNKNKKLLSTFDSQVFRIIIGLAEYW